MSGATLTLGLTTVRRAIFNLRWIARTRFIWHEPVADRGALFRCETTSLQIHPILRYDPKGLLISSRVVVSFVEGSTQKRDT